MAIIEMIPCEYWRQMYEELNRIDWEHFRTDADIAREKAHERLAAENQRRWREEHRAELNAYHREWRKRKKAEKAAQEKTELKETDL